MGSATERGGNVGFRLGPRYAPTSAMRFHSRKSGRSLPRGKIGVKKITLHEEIYDILNSKGDSSMTTSELAALVNQRGRYRKRDGSPVTAFQVHGRTRNYPNLFERNGSRVRSVGPVQADPEPRHAPLHVSSLSEHLSSIEGLRILDFQGFLIVGSLRHGKMDAVPTGPGVYVLVREGVSAPRFMVSGSGGWYQGNDPNVLVAELLANWVDGARILYVGKTDGSLRTRIRTMIRFGEGRAVAHRGGRYVWQLEDAADLRVCWKEVGARKPRAVEREMIEAFRSSHGGRRPFANLRD